MPPEFTPRDTIATTKEHHPRVEDVDAQADCQGCRGVIAALLRTHSSSRVSAGVSFASGTEGERQLAQITSVDPNTGVVHLTRAGYDNRERKPTVLATCDTSKGRDVETCAIIGCARAMLRFTEKDSASR